MEWKNAIEERPEINRAVLVRVVYDGKASHYFFARLLHPFDQEKKYNENYYVWRELNCYLCDQHEKKEVDKKHEWSYLE